MMMSSYFLNAAGGDLRTVKRMLADGSGSIGETDVHGNTALLLSCRSNALPNLQWLLAEGGASIGERNNVGDSALLLSARMRYIPMLRWLLSDGGANIRESNKHGSTALLLAASSVYSSLPMVQWLLAEGGASVRETDMDGSSALHLAACCGSEATVEWLVGQGGSQIDEMDNAGNSALLRAAGGGQLKMVQWLVEQGGSKIEQVNHAGTTIWDLLSKYLVDSANDLEDADVRVNPATVTALLRVMLLRGAPPDSLTAQMAPEHVRVVEDGACLRAYLARRQAIMDAHCPLLAPLQALVHGYEALTVDELWAMDFGAVAKRPRTDDLDGPLLDRPARLRKF